MNNVLLPLIVFLYFGLLLAIAYFTSKNASSHSFFTGDKKSPWYLVAFGMIGTSLSGVTFVSVPGTVTANGFYYYQMVLGFFIGYFIVAYVLLPLYYKYNLSSIYRYLEYRLGFSAYKWGAGYFILSRTLGATVRLYLVINVLQLFVFDDVGIPFWLSTIIIIAMIIAYTFRGGVKTIVWTDTLQTSCMLLGLVICVFYILNQLHVGFFESLSTMADKGYTKIFFTEPSSKLFFVKQILAGAFVTITMTGMDQEMMQKNISVKNLKDAQKNMITIGFTMLFVISLFLFLGGLLHLYAAQLNVTAVGDDLFPTLALQHMPPYLSIIFILALISALFPSADGAITALTSSFCIDILGLQRNKNLSEAEQKKIRQRTHLTFALIFLIMVMVFKWIDNKSTIDLLLKIASYTYGPLLGLFAFGILTKRSLNNTLVPVICVLAPILCLVLDYYQAQLFGDFRIGQELLIINGGITFIGLWLISRANSEKN